MESGGLRGWRWRRRTKMEWRTEEEETKTERMEEEDEVGEDEDRTKRRGWRRTERMEEYEVGDYIANTSITLLPY